MMRYKFTLVITGLIILSGIYLSVMHNVHQSPVHYQTQVFVAPVPASTQKIDANYGLPTRLEITKLKVDTHVIYM